MSKYRWHPQIRTVLNNRWLGVVKDIFGLSAGITFFVSMTSFALAHGAGVEIYRQLGGNYELVVSALPDPPVVGIVHITVSPLDAESGRIIPDAQITIVTYDELGNPKYRARAVNTPTTPRYYDANFTIESEGNWILVVETQSDDIGSATFNVPIFIGPQTYTPGLGGIIIWLLVITAFVGGVAYIWHSSNKALHHAINT